MGKRCNRNWFFFFLLSVTYILCKKGPLGQKTNFKGITVKGKHALGQLLFYSLLLDMFFVSSKDLATYKKVGKCNAKNLLKTYYKNFKKFKKLLIKTLFANFKFRGTSYSEIMPNFCRPHAMSVFKIQKKCFWYINFFYKTKLILIPQAKLYIPSTLNINLILWHTQLIVCAVKC